MKSQSSPRVPGETKQWYEIFPERFDEEAKLMRESYPDFTLHHVSGENTYWTGTARVFKKEEGNPLYDLEIKIECPPNYPEVFPEVYDPRQVLIRQRCPHLTRKGISYILCYGNRLDKQLDFSGAARVKNVVDYICIFLARQWYFERYGEWPGGQPHGALAFLEYEICTRRIDPDEPCPCGLNARSYRNCHMPSTSAALIGMDNTPGLARKLERNEMCPCRSGKKWKKCCALTVNYPNSRTFLALRFPEWFGISIVDRDDILRRFAEKGDEFQALRASPS